MIQVTSKLELALWKISMNTAQPSSSSFASADRKRKRVDDDFHYESSRMALCGAEVVILNALEFELFDNDDDIDNQVVDVTMAMFDYDVSWMKGLRKEW